MKKTKIDLVSEIKKLVEDSIGMTSTWEQNQVKYHKMRMRIKKAKNFPFVGCANIRMPTVETKIRKLKAALNNVIFGIRPIVQVIPSPGSNWQTAIKIEKFLDHLLMDVIKIKDKCIIATDRMLEKGFFLIKPYWKTTIIKRIEDLDMNELSVEDALFIFNAPDEDIKKAIIQKYDIDMNDLVSKENNLELEKVLDAIKSGKEQINITVQDVVCNYPDVALCEPERIYVPTDSGYSPQENAWVIHEFFMPIETVKLNAEIKGWSIDGVSEILNYDNDRDNSRNKNIEITKDLREGISQLNRTGKVKVWEFYGSMDINNDGVPEECVITIAPDFNKIMRKITNPFHSGKRPFVKLFYELTDDRWFSHRGIPEILEDIIKEIDMQHNQKLDQQTIRNTPMYVHRAGMINKNTVQFVFGQSIPAQGMQPLNDLIAPLNNSNSNVEFSYEREQMLLETKIEEMIGQVDFSLQSMINKRQPRTLGEVNLQNQNMQQVFSLDADLLRMSMEELFNWVWELWCQYGDDSYEFAYFGKDGYEPIKLTKEEVQGKYKITVRGNDQNTNPQTRIQKAQMIMAGVGNQIAVQMGVITPMNVANAYKRMYQELEIPNWEELVTAPQPPPPPQPEVRINAKDLTDGEMAQILAKKGIQPDMQGRMMKTMQKVNDSKLEHRNSDVDNYTKIANVIKDLDGDSNGA